MHTPTHAQLRLFTGGFALTLNLLLALLGTVVVINSYNAYGLSRPAPPLQLHRTGEGVVLTLFGEEHLLTPEQQRRTLDAAGTLGTLLLPRELRLGGRLFLLGEAALYEFLP